MLELRALSFNVPCSGWLVTRAFHLSALCFQHRALLSQAQEMTPCSCGCILFSPAFSSRMPHHHHHHHQWRLGTESAGTPGEATSLVQNSKQFALPNTSVSSVQWPCPLLDTQMVFPFYISGRISPDTSLNFITKTINRQVYPHPSPPSPLVLRLKSTEELGERIDTAPDFPIFLIDSGRWANKPAIHPVSIVTWGLQRLQDIWNIEDCLWYFRGKRRKSTGSSSPWSDWPFCGYLYLMNCWLQPHQPLNLWSKQITRFQSLWIPGVHSHPCRFRQLRSLPNEINVFRADSLFSQAGSKFLDTQMEWFDLNISSLIVNETSKNHGWWNFSIKPIKPVQYIAIFSGYKHPQISSLVDWYHNFDRYRLVAADLQAQQRIPPSPMWVKQE